MKIPHNLPWRSTGITLGRGGQGDVQLVTSKEEPQGPEYALKILRNVGSRQARERFRREIEVVKTLESPAIIKVIDHSQEDDKFQFYVMEYHEGAKNLGSIIFSDSNPYDGDIMRSLDLFEQIISAVRSCRMAKPPIVHRDINPQNILVLADHTIRLIDFGVCQIQDGTIITMVDENIGARNYTSPECEAGYDTDIDSRSDIYSASKVLWSVITSRRAFAREGPVFDQQSMGRLFPTNPETWHLAHIFEKTIRQNPADRFDSISGVINLVREIRHKVQRGFPPLELLSSYCPSCGWGNLKEFSEGNQVFGNPNPQGVISIMCSLCGFAFVRNMDTLRASLNRMEGLN